MNSRIVFIGLMALFAIFVAGCEKKDFTKTAAKMHWDRDMCERCKMAISDRKFAVQAVGEDGKLYRFDDIGCLILWQAKERPDLKFKKIWITDAETGEWIDAEKALYTMDALTPMGYGFAAYSRKNFPKGKKPLDFAEVKKRIIKIGR